MNVTHLTSIVLKVPEACAIISFSSQTGGGTGGGYDPSGASGGETGFYI